MLSFRSANMVQSDKGFSVEVLGRTGITYREGEREMFVDSEVLAHGFGMAIFSKSIKAWKSPHEGEVITPQKRDEIIENIRQALAFQQQSTEVL